MDSLAGTARSVVVRVEQPVDMNNEVFRDGVVDKDDFSVMGLLKSDRCQDIPYLFKTITRLPDNRHSGICICFIRGTSADA
jgi:hypothetical protein